MNINHIFRGGGNVENIGMDRSRPPLRWMVLEASALGLCTAPFERELTQTEQIEIKESLTVVWWPLEILPLKRLTYTRRENRVLSLASEVSSPQSIFHFSHSWFQASISGLPRKIHEGQKIHSSFLLAGKLINGEPYTPQARRWEMIQISGNCTCERSRRLART